MSNYRLDRERYSQDYQGNRETLNQRRQPEKVSRSAMAQTSVRQGNYRLETPKSQPLRQNNAKRRQTYHQSLDETMPIQNDDMGYTRYDASFEQDVYGVNGAQANWRTDVDDYAELSPAHEYEPNYHRTTQQPRQQQPRQPHPLPDHLKAKWPKGKMKLFSVAVILSMIVLISSWRLMPSHYVNQVNVTGNERVATQDIVYASGIEPWQQVKDVLAQRKQIESMIMAQNPLVSSVSIKRPSWGEVQLIVEERKIVAKVWTNNQWQAVLDNGQWLDADSTQAYYGQVSLDGYPALQVATQTGKVVEVTTMLKSTPQDILTKIESIKLSENDNKPNGIEVKMYDGNQVNAIISTFNSKMTYYDRIVQELQEKKGIINLEVGAYFTPYAGRQNPIRIQNSH